MGLGGMILSFYVSWAFSLICFLYLPLISGVFIVFGKKMKVANAIKMEAIKDLGAMTEETLSALKLVVSFNREEQALKEFD